MFAPCSSGRWTRHGAYLGATAGGVGHAGPVEIRPIVQLDGEADPSGDVALIATLNLALGFATK